MGQSFKHDMAELWTIISSTCLQLLLLSGKLKASRGKSFKFSLNPTWLTALVWGDLALDQKQSPAKPHLRVWYYLLFIYCPSLFHVKLTSVDFLLCLSEREITNLLFLVRSNITLDDIQHCIMEAVAFTNQFNFEVDHTRSTFYDFCYQMNRLD